MPVNPWKGKFPSHNYKEGEEFSIKFKIAPRIIDIVKKYHPKSTLIGYKLSTGTHLDALETLSVSKADMIVYNNPSDLNTNTLYYKSGLTQDIKRDELHQHIQHLIDCEIGYKVNVDFNSDPIENVDMNKYFFFRELEKYVIDEDNHGSIFISDNKNKFTHSRYEKRFASVNKKEMFDANMNFVTCKKFTQALPIFVFLNNKLKHNIIVHTHKDIDLEVNINVPYLPPNISQKSLDNIFNNINLSFYKDYDKIVIKSSAHGYFICYKDYIDALRDFTDRDWTLYDPPKRYINDNTDIFNDVIGEINTILEIGDNYYESDKVNEKLKNRDFVDPYIHNDKHTTYKKYDLVIGKNCIPIIGIDILKDYSNLGNNILFNFPKQYVCNREVECLSGDIKKEISYPVNDKIFHSLIMLNGKPTKEPDTFHTYDKITEKRIYQTFHKNFEIKFRYTKNGVWCLMSKKE